MINTVAVGTDGSDTATKAVEAALDLAERFGAKLVLLSAYTPVSGGRLRQEQREAPEDVQWQISPREDVDADFAEVGKLADARGVEWTSSAGEGDAAEVLVDLAARAEADVLVVGNKGMQRRLLGSVPNTVAHHAGCSVFIVKTT